MSSLSSTSTDAEVWAAYDDNASYAEDASVAKQWRGQFGERREGSDRPRRDGVIDFAAITGGPALRAIADHLRVGEAHPLDLLAEERALPLDRLDQVDARVRECGGQNEAG